jgi:Lon protease-like protein
MHEGPMLPLFPLPVVLFPGATLPLHIFEERYREMVGEAARRKSEFGVILFEDGKLSDAGCTAVVDGVVRRYEDGRFDVATTGRRRFRTLSLDSSEPCLRAWVEFFEDTDPAPPDAGQLQGVARLGRYIAGMQQSRWPDLEEVSQPSFVIANHLPLETAFKQQLLVQRSESERLATIEEHLKGLSRRLKTIERTHRLARTNGQGAVH